MIAFLNERSLEAHSDWQSALKLFLVVAQELAGSQLTVFRDSAYFRTGDFAGKFNSLTFPKDQRALVQNLVFSNRYSICWRSQRISSAENQYSCVDPVLTLNDESGCEAAENARVSEALSVVLISAADSVFGGKPRIGITTVGWDGPVELHNAFETTFVQQFIAQQRGHYDRASRSSPRDFQTILEKDRARFRRIGQVERRFSRRIFEEADTRRLYYVDDAHVGHSAHMEVFSHDKAHLGVADIDTGTLDESRRVEGRWLRM